MHRSSGTAADVSQTAPAAESPAASSAVKQVTPEGVLASPFSGQDVADTSPAQSNASAAPVNPAIVQPASVAARSQPVASTYSSRAQSSELSAKGLQVKPPFPVSSCPFIHSLITHEHEPRLGLKLSHSQLRKGAFDCLKNRS